MQMQMHMHFTCIGVCTCIPIWICIATLYVYRCFSCGSFCICMSADATSPRDLRSRLCQGTVGRDWS